MRGGAGGGNVHIAEQEGTAVSALKGLYSSTRVRVKGAVYHFAPRGPRMLHTRAIPAHARTHARGDTLDTIWSCLARCVRHVLQL